MAKTHRSLVTLPVGAAALVITTVSGRADAAEVDIARLLDGGTQWLLRAVAEPPHATEADRRDDDAPRPSSQPLVVLVPRAAVLVRDWHGSMRVAGATTVTDELRPSASTRMAVVRASASGRLSPYVQLGAGQWRLDPALFPSQPCEERFAGQVGGGIELRASSRVAIAGEGSYTFVYREASDAPAPRFLTLVVAARVTW